ncbi:MAG: response regulator transcription factor [Acidimicrobiia bacterium]
MRVLVVDDEPAVRQAVRRALSFDGYDVVLAAEGREALTILSSEPVDVIVLDVLMPQLDGLEVCRRLRAEGDDTPVLLLTARSRVAERVAGLDAGADDYLVKPFALQELLARIRALLRRRSDDGDVLCFGDLTLDVDSREVRRGERRVELTPTEFLLLELFLRHPRRVLERRVVLERVWGYQAPTTSNSLDVYVGYLRRKVEAGGEPRLIQTVRGIGYVLREP